MHRHLNWNERKLKQSAGIQTLTVLILRI